MSTKFGLRIDFDLLKRVTSSNTKPEYCAAEAAILKLYMTSLLRRKWPDLDVTSRAVDKYRNCLLPMQYILIRSRAGCKKYVKRDVFLTASARAYQKHILLGQQTVSIFIANLHAFLTIFYA